MLLNLNIGQACDLIDSPEMIREDQVIPGHSRPCPDSPYGTGYDWLYRYERTIAAFLEPWMKPHHSDLFGNKGLLHQALSNAFCHAHHRNPLQSITVRILLGGQGLIIRVTDCGKGFNVQKLYKHYRKKRRYLTSVGNGIRLMAAAPHYGIFYNQNGTEFSLLYLFEKRITELSPELFATQPEPLVETAV